MDSQHLVDPELAPFLEMFPSVMLSHDNLHEVRNRVLPLPPIEGNGVDLERVTVPGPVGAPDVPLLIYRPAGRRGQCPASTISMAAAMSSARRRTWSRAPAAGGRARLRDRLGRLSARAGDAVPGPVEDCYAGLAGPSTNAAALGIDRARIGVMGESAGGGLAAALALLARDRGEYRARLPASDLSDARRPHLRTAIRIPTPASSSGRPTTTASAGRRCSAQAPGGEDVSPYAAPLARADLAGLPPTFIMTGALDLFLEEDLDYARRLIRAGVPTELHVYPGAFHGFDMMEGAKVAEQARRDSRRGARAVPGAIIFWSSRRKYWSSRRRPGPMNHQLQVTRKRCRLEGTLRVYGSRPSPG